MLDKYLPWIGGIFAAIGLMIIIYDVVTVAKKRSMPKASIACVVILFVAVVGYILTDVVRVGSTWPPLASIAWIALFWIYVILDAIVTAGQVRQYRMDKNIAAAKAQQEQEIAVQKAAEARAQQAAELNRIKQEQNRKAQNSAQKQNQKPKVVIVKNKNYSNK